MKTPHKHHDLIVAWAAGAEIEVQEPSDFIWHTTPSPQWDISREYRIKPKPKPDVVRYGVARTDDFDTRVNFLGPCDNRKDNNIKLTFHTETGKLIKAEVI